jgi:murein DD-endopeptidase MepM/ murein hydrolase activator NlpD
LNSSGLAIGDSVSKEQVLGKVAQNEEGVYKLHFEIWQGTNKLNPEEYLIGKLE